MRLLDRALVDVRDMNFERQTATLQKMAPGGALGGQYEGLVQPPYSKFAHVTPPSRLRNEFEAMFAIEVKDRRCGFLNRAPRNIDRRPATLGK